MELMELFALAALVYVVAGVVKGVSGLGLPATSIGLTTLFLEPRTAIAAVLFPMLVTNMWQVYRSGRVLEAARRYAVFAVVLAVGVLLTTQVADAVSDRALFGVMGAAIIIFVVANLGFKIPPLPERLDRAGQVVMGAVSGVLGGLTGVWAAPMAMYLDARRTSKDEFVRATGLLITIGTVPLVVGYVEQGHLTGPLALMSTALIIPTLLGFSIGERLRAGLSPERFRRIFLYIFLVIGLNLLRRAVF